MTLTTLGHWIQACPTNDDPNFEGRARIKRTTGIPRSMLTVVDDSEVDKLSEEQRQNLMLNADGKHVLARTDEKEWAKHVEKANASAAAQQKAGFGDKELESRGLQCPIDKRLFVDPMKTPCCGKTYCNECITNALIESDLVCPGCDTEDIIIETLVSNEEMKEKIKAYEAEKAAERKASSGSQGSSPKSPQLKNEAIKSEAVDATAAPSPPGSKSPASSTAGSTTNSKKRSASDAADDKLKVEAAPAMKRQKSNESTKTTTIERTSSPAISTSTSTNATNFPAMNQFMPPDMSNMMQNMQNMNFPMMPGMPMPMSMPGMPFMPMPGMMNPGMMQMPNFMPPNFNGMNGMNGMNAAGFPNQQQFGAFPPPNFNNPMPMMNNQQPQFSNQNNNNPQMNGLNGMNSIPSGPRAQTQAQNQGFQKFPPTGPSANKFSNQQRHMGKDEDNAYMRQPVNPHRHQNRQKRVRPSDYREL
jgi:protein MPE1